MDLCTDPADSTHRLPCGRQRHGPAVVVSLQAPEDQQHLLAQCPALPRLQPDALPRVGDCLHLPGGSLWAVAVVVHSWPCPTVHRVDVWLEHVRGGRAAAVQ